ncbi:hypothetical protein [Metabacillus malikii]|uniref:Phosphoglycerol transferase MdoB-like AlkP superfamily enzyme n=1 Tax=Metabacillus malikii TaxID=1504265 RepID=A0ABT9ZAF8_9BACI|nr:hypothetical protein [Metabacillus malikii]MDQ0229240.1 phosphoglycerol transferase MdoB-like AlkP superfamily enzyme [Metabacillus malikii]
MIIKRKLLTAVLSSLLFSIVFMVPDGLNMNGFLNLYYMNFIFVITYGVITSYISDWISEKFITKTSTRELVSLLLHCLFGSVFFLLSLISAVIFFITDRLLRKVNIKWSVVVTALLIVIVVFILGLTL